jgi:hypothetical protein
MLFKAIGIWLVIVMAAIFNGVLREKLLVPAIGASAALPLSGILLAVMVFLVTFLLISFIGGTEPGIYIWIGLFWVVLTLSFEFLFGYFVGHKSWHEIIQIFNVMKGDLFIVVLFITGISPWLAAKLKGIP